MKARPSGKKPARPAAKEAAARKNTGKAKASAGKAMKATGKATGKAAGKAAVKSTAKAASKPTKAPKTPDRSAKAAAAKAPAKPAKAAGKPAPKAAAKPPRGKAAKVENGASEEVAGHVEPLTASETAALLEHVRAIVRRLPETTEVEAWGHPTFRVKDKIFVGYGVEDGSASLGVKTTPDMQAALVSSDPRFSVAAYVGKHGWVSMSLAGAIDLAEVEALVRGSYRLVAPSKLVQQLDAED